jgi:hypothetical protein
MATSPEDEAPISPLRSVVDAAAQRDGLLRGVPLAFEPTGEGFRIWRLEGRPECQTGSKRNTHTHTHTISLLRKSAGRSGCSGAEEGPAAGGGVGEGGEARRAVEKRPVAFAAVLEGEEGLVLLRPVVEMT